ncbi:MAG: SAM-dependent methyltransferase, partial [Marivirga sp.]|nr:SAM-dependent methyltransferase [Marivirga sp.]
FKGAENQGPKTLEAIKNPSCGWFYEARPDNFRKIPGTPIAYWASEKTTQCFVDGKAIGEIAETRKGMGTGDNARFVRYWHELSFDRLFIGCATRKAAMESGKKWFPYNDGGAFRKWYGNNAMVVNWENDGVEAKANAVIKNNGGHWSRYLVSLDYFFKPGITWSAISSASFSARLFDEGYLFSSAGMCLFSNPADRFIHVALLNSAVSSHLLTILSPTLNYGAGEIGRLPYLPTIDSNSISQIVESASGLSKIDWDDSENSWDFSRLSWLSETYQRENVATSWENWSLVLQSRLDTLKALEQENNGIFIEAYGLQGEISPEVPDSQITLARADREKDCQR